MKEDKRKCRKVAFADENSALFTMKKIHKTSERGVKPIRAYKCKICNNWHLTSKPDLEALKKENEELKIKHEELQNQIKAISSQNNKEERLEVKRNALIKQLQHQLSLALEKLKKMTKERNEILSDLIRLKASLPKDKS